MKTPPSGFPGCPVVNNLPASAGDTYPIPDLGRSNDAVGQLSPCTTTIEPVF